VRVGNTSSSIETAVVRVASAGLSRRDVRCTSMSGHWGRAIDAWPMAASSQLPGFEAATTTDRNRCIAVIGERSSNSSKASNSVYPTARYPAGIVRRPT
jgi:hypothetical protein